MTTTANRMADGASVTDAVARKALEDAEDLLLREFLGVSTPEVTKPAARWIRSQQGADGAWATFFGGPGDLSTTVEAWVALCS